jgi:hypothetical protein
MTTKSFNMSEATTNENPLDNLNVEKVAATPTHKEYYRPAGSTGTFWHKTAEEWISLNRPLMEISLKNRGFSPFIDTKHGDVVSELENKIFEICARQRVFYAGPLAGYKQGLYEFQGKPALVTESMRLIEPKKGKWPTLYKVFDLVWNDRENKLDQRTLLFGHWAHALQSLHQGIHSGGLALTLAGEHKSGKSLTAKLMIETMGKRFAQPYKWMTGKDNFNEEISESTVLLVDDENANTSHKARSEFGASIKQVVAVPGARIRGLHQKAATLLPTWRLIICLNTEPDRICVMPSLDNDIQDKILILKAIKTDMPMKTNSLNQQQLFWKTLTDELPAFVDYLLNEFVMPEEMTDRFGVIAWQHPEIERALADVAPEATTDEFIERYFKRNDETLWQGTAAELRYLLLTKAGLTYQEESEVDKSTWLGRRLGKLANRYPNFYDENRKTAIAIWTIRRRHAALTQLNESDENVTRLENDGA